MRRGRRAGKAPPRHAPGAADGGDRDASAHPRSRDRPASTVYGRDVLTVVPTPLGNLRDITLRALDALGEASVIACEDTRRTRALLSALAIPAPELVACDERREPRAAGQLVARALAGEAVVLVSDAGMPLIADPGRILIARALAAGCEVTVLPGPSAVETALVASGLAGEGYAFLGWVPRTAGERARCLEAAVAAPLPSVLFESPHRLAATLAELARVAPGHPVAVARELTKLHEEVARGSAAELAARGVLERGEICLVVGAAPRAEQGRARARGARRGARADRARAARAAGQRARGEPDRRVPGAASTTRRSRRHRLLHCPDAAPRRPVLRHDADLLRQRRAPPRPRLHDDRGRRGDAARAPLRVRTPSCSRAPTSTARRSRRPPRPRGSRPRSSPTRSPSASASWRAASRPRTTSSSARRIPSTRSSCSASSSACARAATSTRAPTRALLHRLRGLLQRGRPGRRALSRARHRADVHGGAQHVLPALGVRRRAARALCGRAAVRAPADAPQRGALARRGRAPGRLDHARVGQLGRAAAVGSRSGDLRLDRRADQLHLRAHVRAPGGGSDRARCGPRAGSCSARTSCASTP